MNDITKDIEFVKSVLPDHYTVQESKKKGSIHCNSSIGIRLPTYTSSDGVVVDDAEDEETWNKIFNAFKTKFGKRFQEVFHNTCFCHVDFTIYLKHTDVTQLPSTR